MHCHRAERGARNRAGSEQAAEWQSKHAGQEAASETAAGRKSMGAAGLMLHPFLCQQEQNTALFIVTARGAGRLLLFTVKLPFFLFHFEGVADLYTIQYNTIH